MKVLLLNQCFYPDLVATAQQLTGVARGLVERGHTVTVITGRRGYDDASLKFPARERWQEIDIIRVPSIGLGKSSRWRRGLNFASYSAACAFRLARTRSQDTVIALTSPPLISWLASLFTRMKGGRLVFWVMDLNPDEAIAAGWLKSDSMTAKLLNSLLKSSMQHSEKIIVLDRFMKSRIVAKAISEQKIEVIPPSHDGSVGYDAAGREAFRLRHRLAGKFVVMYAGNHSPCHPLDTLLAAANELRARRDIEFCFVGGGSGVRKVKEFARTNQIENISCLPYQPQAELSALLSAADLHVVIMGEAFPGIVHPCKIYNILAIGSPFLYIGPRESHLQDIISCLPDQTQASSAENGDVSAVVKFISDRFESWRRDRVTIPKSKHFVSAQELVNSLPRFIAQIESTELIGSGAVKLQSIDQTSLSLADNRE